MSSPWSAAVREIAATFDRSTACLDEADAAFAPREGMYTVAQHVAHAAQTIDWFVEGAFRPEGFRRDFRELDAEVRAVASLADARAWFARAVDAAAALLATKTPADMAAPIADGPVLGGAPRSAILAAMGDHTAHHRGALTVYARLRGKTPAMPYA
jgi:uncharacterized damage-inducible protein DinB